MQESSYLLNAKNKQCGIPVTDKDKHFLDKDIIHIFDEGCIIADIGISQIHYKTAKAFKFQMIRLMLDLEYSVEAGAIVLADFMKRYSKREEDWWTRYNASSRSKRNIYKNLVSRYF